MRNSPTVVVDKENAKDLVSTSTEGKVGQSSQSYRPNGSNYDYDDVSTTVTGNSNGTSTPSPPPALNGVGNHADEEETWEEKTPSQSSFSASSTYRSYPLYNGNSIVSTSARNYSKVEKTSTCSSSFKPPRSATETVGSSCLDYLKDNGTSVSSSSSNPPIPLPAPSSSSFAVGGNATYGSRNSPSPITSTNSYWNTGGFSRLDPGDVGLCNLGNTCFMNSALQSLIHSAHLAEYFLKTTDLETGGPACVSLVQAFQSLMHTAWQGNTASFSPIDFKTVLGNIHNQFKDSRQHDCQEFLALTLDTIHEQLKKWKSQVNRPVEVFDPPGSDGFKTERGDGDSWKNDSKDDVFNNGSERPFSQSIRKTSPKDMWLKFKEPCVAPTSRLSLKHYRKASSMDTSSLSQNPGKRARFSDDRENHSAPSSTQTSDPYDFSDDTTPPLEEIIPPMAIKRETKSSSSVTSNSRKSSVSPTQKRTESTPPVEKAEVPTKRRRESLEELTEKVDSFWNKHLAENNTVIGSTFQGVYKSTVICSACQFVSVTYEPFMYLSLPIPRTLTRTLNVFLCCLKSKPYLKVNVTAKLTDTMTQLKEEVVKNIPAGTSVDLPGLDNFVIAEVVNYHVTRTLDNSVQVKQLDDTNRDIYMYELNDNFDEKYPVANLQTFNAGGPTSALLNSSNSTATKPELIPNTYISENWETDLPALIDTNGQTISSCSPPPELASCSGTLDGNNMETNESTPTTSFVPAENGHSPKSGDYGLCCICQEDCPRSELRRHDCDSILCRDCIKRAAQYFENSDENVKKYEGGTHLNCPICRVVVEHEKDYHPLLTTGPTLIMTSVLLRSDPISDTNNNSAYTRRLFGTPLTIKIPSTLPAEEFYEFIRQINPLPDLEHTVLSVNRDGTQCDQCISSKQCKGCEFPMEGNVSIARNSSIAICFKNISEEQIASIEPSTMATSTKGFSFSAIWSDNEPAIDIHYCLRTFSESEILDDQNPWFCPTCKKNQCATKTMTICKFPDYLIVYLKRFVFIDQASNKLNNKLKFPINDLDLRSYLAPECATDASVYDLYSCICHFGSASSGHYTAYGKNPVTQRWHYFNDDSVSAQPPSECEYSSAYVLFYQRKGLHHDIPKVKRPPFQMARPVGLANPIAPPRTYSNYNNQPDSSVGFGNSRPNTPEEGLPAIRVGDENSTIDEVRLSVGHNSRYQATSTNPNPSSISRNERNKKITGKASRVSAPKASKSQDSGSDEDIDLPDIEEGAGDEGKWAGIERTSQTQKKATFTTNGNRFNPNSALNRNCSNGLDHNGMNGSEEEID